MSSSFDALAARLTKLRSAGNPARLTTACVLALSLLGACNTFTSETGEQTITAVDFDPAHPGEVRIGEVVFMAGFRLEYGARFFGGLSGLWVSPGGDRMIAVTDHGDWVSAPLSHDAAGRMTGVGTITMRALTGIDADSIDTILDPQERDAEGLAMLPDGRAIVSFERRHRIWVYDGPMSDNEPLELDPPLHIGRLQNNGGLEAIETMPDGRLIAIAEEPIGPGLVVDMWVLETNGKWRSVGYLMRDGFKVTGAAALPDGRVIVLERWFAAPGSIRNRLRELTPEQIDGEVIVDGRVLAEFTSEYNIDNFEGLSARTGPNGETFLYMVSDDNFNEGQKTYLYQFRLEP